MAVFGKETFKIKGMIASQRRAHKFIWLGMAVAIPVLLVFTISSLDFSVAEISQKEQVTVQKVGSNIKIHELSTIIEEAKSKAAEYNFRVNDGSRGNYMLQRGSTTLSSRHRHG